MGLSRPLSDRDMRGSGLAHLTMRVSADLPAAYSRYRVKACARQKSPAIGRGLSKLSSVQSSCPNAGRLCRNGCITPLIDPRFGDVEDDASSTKRRSLFALAGSLLAEVSLPKLVWAWMLLMVLPAMLLGLAPLLVSGWLATLSRKFADPLSGTLPLLVLVAVAALGWFGGRPLYRIVEQGFWSLNSVAVQPGYALCREGLRHLMEHLLLPRGDDASSARVRAVSAAGAGIALCRIVPRRRAARVAGIALAGWGRGFGIAASA